MTFKNVGDSNAKQVSFEVFQQEVEVLSLHIPWTQKQIRWSILIL
jgi:hypothetical protein